LQYWNQTPLQRFPNTRSCSICSFETMLFANFYTALGSVAGSGVASMQFGTNTSRRLRSGAAAAGRNLQDDEVAGASEFELDFPIAEADNGTSGASSMGVMSLALLALTGVAALV
jgi:hypothetical protein